MNDGMSTLPQGIEDEIITILQGSQGEFSRVHVLTTKEYDIIQEIIVTRKKSWIPQGNAISLLTSILEGTEDDIIIVHQGTPEDLFSVVQGTLQEIVGVPKGNSISKGPAGEVIGIPNQIIVYDETGKEISGRDCGDYSGNQLSFPRDL